jgi:hypothetical protein
MSSVYYCKTSSQIISSFTKWLMIESKFYIQSHTMLNSHLLHSRQIYYDHYLLTHIHLCFFHTILLLYLMCFIYFVFNHLQKETKRFLFYFIANVPQFSMKRHSISPIHLALFVLIICLHIYQFSLQNILHLLLKSVKALIEDESHP